MRNDIKRCRSEKCNKPVVWLDSATGARMIVDAETVDDADKAYDAKKHRSHFATCPDVEAFRGKGRASRENPSGRRG